MMTRRTFFSALAAFVSAPFGTKPRLITKWRDRIIPTGITSDHKNWRCDTLGDLRGNTYVYLYVGTYYAMRRRADQPDELDNWELVNLR